MTSTALAIPQATKRDLDILGAEAKLIARSSLIPAALRGKPDEILTLALMGRQLGLTLVDSCLYIVIVNGRPFTMTTALASMLNVRGIQWMFEHTDASSCTVMGRHPNDPADWPLRRLTFTMKEAVDGGLTKNPAYKSAPADMLRHRTLGKWVRANCPEVLTGLQSTGIGLMETDGEVTIPAAISTDDEILDAELVDDTPPPPPVDTWAAEWSARVRAAGGKADTARMLLEYATAGRVASTADCTCDTDRKSADLAVDAWIAGGLVVDAGRMVDADPVEGDAA